MAFLILSLNLKIVQLVCTLVRNAQCWFATPIAAGAPYFETNALERC